MGNEDEEDSIIDIESEEEDEDEVFENRTVRAVRDTRERKDLDKMKEQIKAIDNSKHGPIGRTIQEVRENLEQQVMEKE